MKSRRHQTAKPSIAPAYRQSTKSHVSWTQRARRQQLGTRDQREPFSPPEDWHEPKEDGRDYKIIIQSPGEGYRHVVTPEQIQEVAIPVIAHRLVLDSQSKFGGLTAERVVQKVVEATPVPA